MAIDLTEANLQGVGRGSAQVWGTNRALAGLQQQHQQELLRKQKEEAEMADQLAKVNYDGVRNEDIPDITNKYDGIRNTFAKIRGTTNRAEVYKLQAEFNAQKLDFSRVVGNSKDAKAQIAEGYKLRIARPDEVSEFYDTDLNDVNKTPTSSPDFKKKVELYGSRALSPKFDEVALIKNMAPFAVEPYQSDVKSRRINGGTERYREEGERLNVNSFTQQIIKQASSNRGLQRYITQAYPNMDIADATLAYAQQRAKDIAPTYKVQEKIVDKNMDDKFANHQAISDDYIRRRKADGISESGSGNVNELVDSRRALINDIKTTKPNAAEKLGAFIQGNPQYSSSTKFAITRDPKHPNNPDRFILDIPAKVKLNSDGSETIQTARTPYALNKKDPNFEIKMNQVINSITDQKIDIGYSFGLSGNQKGTNKKVSSKPSTVKKGKYD